MSYYEVDDLKRIIREVLREFLTEKKEIKYPYMRRPEWQPFMNNVNYFVNCSCGKTIETFELLRKHWQEGHFDILINQGDEK